jgi:ectoine hydroxylase-related dioxygenase (phytanoyl-CoA dioxygenase family)
VGKKGDAVLFDRRCFHAASPNLHADPSGPSRLIAFYAYSYRWLRPKNDW